MSSTTRKALRDFYKLENDTETTEDKVVVEEDETFEKTKIEELDDDKVDVGEFVNKLADSYPLNEFVEIANQIRREEQMLASAQRELVNDNYKKLIKAAETLNYLSSQGDLAEVDSLEEPVKKLQNLNKNNK